ncbi:VRR-NUC domain-containing protein [Enterobacter roggenkampii]|uniref:VRR-NUC domain-containing protein n=1 Tax=Enterobacter roggenkampii TaxID=1812935 RepID=UPI0020755102|nr:VRR-NUC domain-containing protein [Enterobacter roggenkampii]MCM7572013.1 VRR-NUC domain-containing protein [Enterobacter roggenkampii]MEB6621142.1 VRR-NUC domain-containing protein [Enterobacter roggenkampii]HDS3775677.1 VRR-NUC domain-containing protein [Enterobacter roggenkampii]HDT2143873.1 VRR-NUC domain-containing protein [Enterobacter roggenkampii]
MELTDLPTSPDSPDIPSGKNNQPWDCTTTGVEMVEKQSQLPTENNRQYLHIKVEYAMRFPRLSAKIRRNNKSYQMSLKQLMMSGLIRADEIAAKYYWWYKAEVPFDIRTTPPRPYLSSTQTGPGRRHTTNPFPEPGKGIYRRPDVIIVKNRKDRWPGLAGPDTEGVMHADNLERLVEVKFPEDELKEGQYRDYMLIVGGPGNEERMTILEIHDCRPQEQQWSDQVVNVTLQNWVKSGAKYWPLYLYPPIFTPRPPDAPAPARIQPWTYVGDTVADLSEGAIRGIAEGWNALSKEMQQKLQRVAGWLNDSGVWVYSQGSQAWHWASRTGRSIASWTDEQLRTAWREIQQATDMTLEMLKEVDWVQVLTDAATAIGVILVAVGVGVLLVTLGIPEAIIGAFLLIVRLAISAWGTLAAILGAGTTVAVAP